MFSSVTFRNRLDGSVEELDCDAGEIVTLIGISELEEGF